MSDVQDSGEEPAIPSKEDPETLVLRGSPHPIVRFRRGLIIGITAVVAGCLVTVTWFALEPPSFRLTSEDDGGGDPLRKAAPDALANAPSSYGEIPRLGPPLPGDLGPPILAHQQSLDGVPPMAAPDPSAAASERARSEEAERQRLAAVRAAARTSGVIVQLSGSSSPGESTGLSLADDATDALEESDSDGPALPSAPGQQRKIEFARRGTGDINPHRLREAPSPWTLSAGTVIPASLITGLNSDLPGMVLAQVTQNVSDSATGRTVLVPQGARLIGSYDSVVAFGQQRALVVWQRIVFPGGSSIRLDNMPATDLAGYAGLEDEVDFHTWRLLGGVALSTLLGVGTELSFGSGEGDLVRAVREATQQNAGRAGEQITSRNLEVQPTITVRPGWPLRAIIHKDLVLRPWRG